MPDDRKAVALYVGDWDPSGLYMSEVDLPRRLERYGSLWSFERIALTHDDLAGLPHFDTASKSGDVRLKWYLQNTSADTRKSWELDAMDPTQRPARACYGRDNRPHRHGGVGPLAAHRASRSPIHAGVPQGVAGI